MIMVMMRSGVGGWGSSDFETADAMIGGLKLMIFRKAKRSNEKHAKEPKTFATGCQYSECMRSRPTPEHVFLGGPFYAMHVTANHSPAADLLRLLLAPASILLSGRTSCSLLLSKIASSPNKARDTDAQILVTCHPSYLAHRVRHHWRRVKQIESQARCARAPLKVFGCLL